MKKYLNKKLLSTNAVPYSSEQSFELPKGLRFLKLQGRLFQRMAPL